MSDKTECYTCEEDGMNCGNVNECPDSKSECGHHCNHIWTHDVCCWCEGTTHEDAVEVTK